MASKQQDLVFLIKKIILAAGRIGWEGDSGAGSQETVAWVQGDSGAGLREAVGLDSGAGSRETVER